MVLVLTVGLIAKWVAAAGFTSFMSFIFEESIQTQGFNVQKAIQAKNWSEASRQNGILQDMITQLSLFNNTVGWINPLSKIAFDTTIKSAQEQVNLYGNLINDTDSNAPSWPNFYRAGAEAIKMQDASFMFTPPSEVFTAVVDEVIDGDTIIVKPFVVRLVGLNAPEMPSKEGQDAKTYVISRLMGREVTVKVDPANQLDVYNRLLGVVFLGDENFNKTMITQGYAPPAFAETNKYFTPEEMREAAAISLSLTSEAAGMKYAPVTTSALTEEGQRESTTITKENEDTKKKRLQRVVQYRYVNPEEAAKKDHDIITEEQTELIDDADVKTVSKIELPRSSSRLTVKTTGARVMPTPAPTPTPTEVVNAVISKAVINGQQIL